MLWYVYIYVCRGITMAVLGSTLAQVEIFSMQWVYGPRAYIAKITSRFHDWVTERMIMSSTEIRTTEDEL